MVVGESVRGAGLYGLGADMDRVDGFAERTGVVYGEAGDSGEEEDERGETDDEVEAQLEMEDFRGV
jgi:hypothetical protein